MARRLRVVMSYQAAGLEAKLYGGLCNQIYVHVGMLTVAAHMGAEAVRGVRRRDCYLLWVPARRLVPSEQVALVWELNTWRPRL